MCFRTRAFSHFLIPHYQTLQSKGLFKTDKHLTGDAVFQLFIVLWISLQFDEHPFMVQHHSPSHFSSSACRCRNARPWAWEGRCFSWAEAAGALPVPPQPGRGGGRSQWLSQFRSHTFGSQTRPDSVPKPSLPSTTPGISDPTQQVPVRNTSKERS